MPVPYAKVAPICREMTHEIAHLGEVGEPHPARFVHLAQDDLTFRAVLSSPSARMRRSSVRRTPRGSSGYRLCSSSNTVTGRICGAAVSIGTTSASKRWISGSGRRRPRGSRFCEGSHRSFSMRYALGTLIAAFAAAAATDSVSLSFMYNLIC